MNFLNNFKLCSLKMGADMSVIYSSILVNKSNAFKDGVLKSSNRSYASLRTRILVSFFKKIFLNINANKRLQKLFV